MNLEEAKNEFLKYTEPYKDLSELCLLKIHHTFRVMDLCREIAEDLGLQQEDVELAMYCGLLHDIGRFEQWRRYETFDDSKSFDHAEIGIEVLQENHYINQYLLDISLQKIVLESIRYHNKYEIPKNLSEREQLFCNIVRDADKVDILYLCSIGHIQRDIENDSFSDKIYHDLLEEKQIHREDVKTKEDTLAISLGLVYGIHYSKSIEILKEKDYMNQIITLYEEKTENVELKKQLECVREQIANYMEGRNLC